MNSLPDVCLLTLLDKIPLDYLIRDVSLVCRRWRDIVPSARARRRTLEFNFLVGMPVSTAVNVDSISLKHCNPEAMADRLIALFINITSLKIHSQHGNFGFALCQLFTDPWSYKLTSLKLGYIFEDQSNDRLVETINSLPSLKKLSLKSLSKTNYQFPILKRLEVFRYSFLMSIRPYTWFEQFANANQNLRRVEFTIIGLDSDAINSLLMFSPQLARKFTRLFDRYIWELSDVISKMPQLLSHFSSLQEFGIFFNSKLSFVDPFRCLIPLKQLTTLNLHFDHGFLASLNLSGQTDLIPLKSVNKLNIKMNTNCDKIKDFHQLMRSVEFGHLFPNLKVTDLKVYTMGYGRSYTEQQLTELCRDMIEPLQKCAALQKVYYSLWSVRSNGGDPWKKVWSRPEN